MPSAEPVPDACGHFGPYGGIFVPETLMSALHELATEYDRAKTDREFQNQLSILLRDFAGRPTPLYLAERLTKKLAGPKIYLKREDLLHTGAHKINNAVGQILLAQRMGKRRIIAETGAGQHGVATATVAARFGCECVIYMGQVDMERQALNVARMKFLRAKVVPVTAGQATLKEAINEAMRDWVTNVRTTHYILGSVLGSHPYPMMVRDFQSIIGVEARHQILEREGRQPDLLVACVGGGSNAIGLFHPFLHDRHVQMVGVEAGGEGIRSGKHAARFQGGRLGVLQGTKTFLLANEEGQIELTHSVSAGLDYAAVGPEHSYLRDLGRVEYTYATDDEALNAFGILSETEGIIPALETAHAIAYLVKNAPKMKREQIVIVNCHNGSARTRKLALDTELARSYHDAMRALQKTLDAPGEITIGAILQAPGVMRAPEEAIDSSAVWPAIERALRAALTDLIKMREREGKHLAKDLIRRLKAMRKQIKEIRGLHPDVVKKYRAALLERIHKAGLPISSDDERLTKEITFFADRADVSEELTRVESHLAQFAHHLRRHEPVGRTLEFITQEIFRELNTLGAKANDAAISQRVVVCKAELEKIREQIQKLE